MHYQDLMTIIKSPDVDMVLEAFEMIEAVAATEAISPFEYEFAFEFIKNSMLTTFPDYRQKFMRLVFSFFTRLRTSHERELKKDALACQQLINFLA